MTLEDGENKLDQLRSLSQRHDGGMFLRFSFHFVYPRLDPKETGNLEMSTEVNKGSQEMLVFCDQKTKKEVA